MENEAIEMVDEVTEAAPEIFVAVGNGNKSFMKGAAVGSAATLGCVLAYKFVIKPVAAKIKKRTYTKLYEVTPEELEDFKEEIEDDFEE